MARTGLPAALLRVASTAARCSCAAVRELSPAAPGTVTPYNHHVFIRSAPPEDLAPPETSGRDGLWWPSVVEKLPVFARAFLGVARHRAYIEGTVKVTAFEALGSRGLPRLRPDECDLMLFPDGVEYRGLPVVAISDIVAAHVTEPTEEHPDFEPPELPPGAGQMQDHISGLCLFVCCHGSRDGRCGSLGEALARRLEAAAREAGLLGDPVRVFRCSHIGGHKYAANVCVYGPASPCDGDWFGGVRAADAPAFLQALLRTPIGSEGVPADPLLARHWRGRMGLSKDDQMRLAAGEALNAESSEEEEELSAEDDLSKGEEVRFSGPWSREGGEPEDGVWDRPSFARLFDAGASSSEEEGDDEDEQESSSDFDDDDWGSDEDSSKGSSSESDSEDPDAGPPLR
ncbi:hypothetical protein WJX81_002585 [Elliptochloris bilobata]|uniref:Uncharacterized protein n=1 Tax=Elliptochloris bilobata TaxID=381761 RepID=A0AAW1R372_9CHLO